MRTLLIFAATISSQRLFSQSYIAAHPYGGSDSFKYFISREMVYPEEAKEIKLNGVVIVKCKISEDGAVTGILLEGKNINFFREEALRLFKLIQWEPAYQYSEPIESEAKLKIVFNHKRYSRWVERRGYDEIDYHGKAVEQSLHIYEARQTDKAPKSILPDSSKELSNYIYKHLKYPQEAYKRNLTGTVRLQFVVEPSGNVSNLHITQGVGGGCNDEASRLLKSIKWLPAEINNVLVRSKMQIDIAFTM